MKRLLIILLMFLGMIPVFAMLIRNSEPPEAEEEGKTEAPAPDCEGVLGQLMETMKGEINPEKVYLKYKTSTIEDGIESPAMMSEIWISGKKVVVKSPGLEMYQDGKNRVVISHTGHHIFIQRVTDFGSPLVHPPGLSEARMIDSLKRYASSVSCSALDSGSRLEIEFAENKNLKFPYKKVVLDLSEKGMINKGKYELRLPEGYPSKIQVYEYVEMSEKVNESVLPADAVEALVPAGKPVQPFAGYTVKDLR